LTSEAEYVDIISVIRVADDGSGRPLSMSWAFRRLGDSVLLT
jgi:hypothetical protein